jgi:hypothetical protein
MAGVPPPFEPLRLAIERLYEMFGPYPLRPHIDACSHCHSEEDHRRLASKPLRELTAVDLHDYAFSATLTWGDDRDYRHFLPRLFESMVSAEEPAVDPETVVGHLRHGEWQSWPPQEQSGIRSFFSAWWSSVIENYPSAVPVEDCLCAIARVEDDVASLTQTWLKSTSVSAFRHLADFVFDNVSSWTNFGTLSNAFWEGREAPMRQVMNLLVDPAVSRRLLEAAVAHSAEPFAERMADASRLLETLRT